MSTPNSRRAATLKQLADEQFDLVIIGGGITGTGIARDAVARGLKVACIEKDDFASGTSSKSTKLIHGGLRYLEQGEIKLVFESVNERKRLMRVARHLVRPLPFLVTNYQGDRRWLVTLDAGLWLYEALCFFEAYKLHKTYGPQKTLELEPGLRKEGLNGGILYYDCSTDDARLTLENALDAQLQGAAVANHVRASSLLKDGTDRVIGISVIDSETNSAFDIRGKVVVNATGPWCDEVRAMMKQPPMLKPTKGVHIVVDDTKLPIRHAMMMASPKDKRAVFAIPFGLGRSVVGTTDTFFDGSPDKVEPTSDDVQYLLDTANSYFPDAKLVVDDVISTWSGLRPLLAPADASESASHVSREHTITENPGFITIAGGKLTTYRHMAAEVVEHALKQLGTHAKSNTVDRPLPGAVGLTESDDALNALAAKLAGTGVPEKRAQYFAQTYGARSSLVVGTPESATSLDTELPYVMSQVDLAVDEEFARSLDDVMSRRLPFILRSRDQGLGVAEKIARHLAKRLEWAPARISSEIANYRDMVDASRRYRK